MIDAAAPLDGLRAQVLTARDVRGHPITDWMYSGLNYQIEHRLFPTMPRPHLHRARTIITAFCAARALSSEEVAPLRAYGQVVTALREGESIMSMLD